MNVVAEELDLLISLDEILSLENVRAKIDPLVTEVEQNIARQPDALMAFEPIPLSVYGDSLPQSIRSSWVFILRAGATTGAERHPNSHQRMMSYRGSGNMQTWRDNRWHSNLLVSDQTVALEQRWISIPINVWHQPVVAQSNWEVVSFHTALASELIEERPRSDDFNSTHQQTYLHKQA